MSIEISEVMNENPEVAADLDQLRWLVLRGMKGDTGEKGDPGFSPEITSSAIPGGHRIDITNELGPDSFNVMDGEDGADGTDGVSPTVTVTEIEGGHRVTITDATGAHPFDVMDGEDGEGGGSSDAVLYTPQSLTDSQKAQARTNVGAGTYSKPSGGIPKTDLASAVQTSLGKADTALQTAPVTSVNTKTGAVTLSASDVGALPSSTSIPTKVSDLTNDSGYQTAAQVSAAISTATASKADKTLRVAMTSSDTTPTLNPNTFYVFPTMASLAPTLNAPSDATIVNEYHFVFDSGSTATVLTLPASVLQPDGFTVEANMHYEISILEGAMTAQGWAVTSA